MPDFTGGDGVWQDLHDGECDTGIAEAYPYYCTQ